MNTFASIFPFDLMEMDSLDLIGFVKRFIKNNKKQQQQQKYPNHFFVKMLFLFFVFSGFCFGVENVMAV